MKKLYNHLSADKERVNVLDFGAKGDGVTNDTAAIIAAEDSLKNGGIVYFPAGVYMIDFVPFRQGVTLLLEGKVDDVSKGYTVEVQERIAKGEFAVIRSVGGSDMFINHDKYLYARHHAVSDFGMSGGVVDAIGRERAYIFCLADNVLLENCIILDSPNNHAIQITGSTNVMIRNCMFAGYHFEGNLYAETIQIEQTHHGAIGPQGFATSNYSFGDVVGSENVTIENCYFGKSAKYGAPLVPIGHHGHNAKASVTHCLIKNCVFDNPLLMGLRVLNFCDFEVNGCTFIGTEQRDIPESDTMISVFLHKPSHRTVTLDEEGNFIYGSMAPDYNCPGSNGVRFVNNRFVLSEKRFSSVIKATGSDFKPGMRTSTYFTEIEYCGGPYKLFHGYKNVNNYLSDFVFTGNDVTILDEAPANKDYLMNFERVYGLTIKNNKIHSANSPYYSWYQNQEAVRVRNCAFGKDADTVTIVGERANGRRVLLPLENGDIASIHCQKQITITLASEKGGKIVTSTDENGNGVVTVKCEKGYRFDGWKGDVPAAGNQERGENLILVAKFSKF